MTPIILASTSASRAALLRGAGVNFAVIAPDVDEQVWKDQLLARGASPGGIAAALADQKATAVSHGAPGLVIGADQTLDVDGRLYDKTRSLAETRARLAMLRGRPHSLHTAATVARDGGVLWRASAEAILTVRRFSDDFLERYLRSQGEALTASVGAYHLEGLGAQLFESVQGDYFSILGLPLISLLGFLREAGGLAK